MAALVKKYLVFGGLENGLKREKIQTNILQQIRKTNAYYLSQNQHHIKRIMSLQLKDSRLFSQARFIPV